MNDTLDLIDLSDIYRAFHRKAAGYTFFSVHTEHPPELITCWAPRQTLANLRKLKPYPVSILIITPRLEINKGKKL